jgi:hypothetical protein
MKANLQFHTQRANAILTMLNAADALTLNVYSGTQPTTASIAKAFVQDAYVDNLLLAYALTDSSFVTDAENYRSVICSNIPFPAVALNTNVATWFALFWNTTYAIVGSVSDAQGDGSLQLSTLNIVSGASYPVNILAFVLAQ